MASRRIFTDRELRLLATPQSIRVAEAARQRDASDLPDVARLMERECTATFGDRWTLALQVRLLELGGDEAHDAAALWAARGSFSPFVNRFGAMTLRERLDALVGRLRASGSTFRVEQNDVFLRFVLEPWGSARLWRQPEPWQKEAVVQREGHRLRYPCSGAHDGPNALPMLTGPRPLTGQAPALPCFLATEILFLELVAVEVLGTPIAVINLPRHAADPATLDVYRDPAMVPDAVFDRLGLERRHVPPPADASVHIDEDQLRRWETPLSVQVETAGAARDWAELDRLSRRMDAELVGIKDPLANFRTGLLTFIAREFGEAAVADAFERSAPFVMQPWFNSVDPDDPKVSIETWGVAFRAHGSTFDAVEDDDTVIFRGRLGACGRMWAPASRHTVPLRVGDKVVYPTFGVYDEPLNYHVLSTAAPMTHGKPGHPVYSAHCHVFHELYPNSVLGRPLFLEFHPEQGSGDIVHVHTTRPGRFPAGAMRRAGLASD